MTSDPLRAKSLRHNSVPAKKKISSSPSEIRWQFNHKDTKINKNPFVTPNNKSCINKRCRLENWGFFCIRYFSKTKSKPAKKITGQCFSTEMEVACENSADLEQETKATKIVTYPLHPLASSNFVWYCSICATLSTCQVFFTGVTLTNYFQLPQNVTWIVRD